MDEKTDEESQIVTPKKGAFLAAFSECGNVKKSAKIVGIDRRTHYRWLEEDADYALLFKDAREDAADMLEEEARRRAMLETGGSDTLLIVLLKANNPDKFRERTDHRHSGPDGKAIQIEHPADPQFARVLAMLDASREE